MRWYRIYIAHKGGIVINQGSDTSKIHVPTDHSFEAIKKGFATKLSFEEDGNMADDFSSQDSENHIELNGIDMLTF